MIKRLQQHTDSKRLRNKKAIEHSISASHELSIMQHISTDQLKLLEQTYTYLLEAIKEARRSKQKADKQTAEIIQHGQDYAPILRREKLKIAWLWAHGKSSREIDKIMLHPNGYCMNRMLASNGRAIKRDLILQAKRRLVIQSVNAGNGIRPTARLVPSALGSCSPTLVIKIMQTEKIRQQCQLPFPLRAV
ncbi:MAG: hypothetical protein JKY87_04185 [Mariprofundus sp.]|nr:hypothetical protein [Mariprofundus sp.]